MLFLQSRLLGLSIMDTIIVRNSAPLLSKSVSTILFTLLILTTTCSAFVPRNGLGHLKMCPPGGEAFATAWQLTCGMRKKRSIEMNDMDSTQTKLQSGLFCISFASASQTRVSRRRRENGGVGVGTYKIGFHSKPAWFTHKKLNVKIVVFNFNT